MIRRDTDRLPGRHTLGSLPDSQESQHPPVLLGVPSLSPPESLTDGAEPLHTIYCPTWYAARRRAYEQAGVEGSALVDLLDVVETGWWAVRELQQWFESNTVRAREIDAYGHLLSFVDGDLVDVYREIAGGAADLVPGWDGWEAEASPDDVAGDVATFNRYLTLLHLAVHTAPVPEPFAVLVQSVAERLRGWADEAMTLVSLLPE